MALSQDRAENLKLRTCILAAYAAARTRRFVPVFYVGYLLWSDIHWYRHAAKAADTGIFMPITHKRFSASRLALFIIAFVILLLTLSLCR